MTVQKNELPKFLSPEIAARQVAGYPVVGDRTVTEDSPVDVTCPKLFSNNPYIDPVCFP